MMKYFAMAIAAAMIIATAVDAENPTLRNGRRIMTRCEELEKLQAKYDKAFFGEQKQRMRVEYMQRLSEGHRERAQKLTEELAALKAQHEQVDTEHAVLLDLALSSFGIVRGVIFERAHEYAEPRRQHRWQDRLLAVLMLHGVESQGPSVDSEPEETTEGQ